MRGLKPVFCSDNPVLFNVKGALHVDKTGADDYQSNFFNVAKEFFLIILVILIVVPFMRKIDKNPFHGDEAYWLRSSIQYKLFFIDRALDSKEFGRCRNEPVGKYIIGLVLHVAGYGDRIEELGRIEPWKFDKDYKWNVDNQRMPPSELRSVVRFAMALFGVLICVLIYWIGRIVCSMKAGIIASLLLAYNPLMQLCCKRAMPDAPLLLFMTATVILSIYFYRSLVTQRNLRTLILTTVIGVNCALATGTKLNGGLSVFIFALFCMYLIVVKSSFYSYTKEKYFERIVKLGKDKEVKSILAGLLIGCITTIAVLIGMTPCLYRQPVNGIVQMVDVRTEHIHIQRTNKWGTSLDTLSKKFNSVVRQTLFPKNYVILGTLFNFPVDFILFLLGLVLLIYSEVKYLLSNSRASRQSIVILWAVVTCTGITVWIPLNYPRYYLPILPCIVIVEGYCIARIYDSIVIFIKRRLISSTAGMSASLEG
jgi:hypothetical protein